MSIVMAILVMGVPSLLGLGYVAGRVKLYRQEAIFRTHARLR